MSPLKFYFTFGMKSKIVENYIMRPLKSQRKQPEKKIFEWAAFLVI